MGATVQMARDERRPHTILRGEADAAAVLIADALA
jgi:hypothetical protein